MFNSTSVPAPSSLQTVNSAPICLARSWIPGKPQCPERPPYSTTLGQCPFHRRESVDAEIRHRLFPSRYVRPVRGGKHFVTTPAQYCVSRLEELDARLVAPLLPARETSLNVRCLQQATIASTPFISGICTSIRVMSGR